MKALTRAEVLALPVTTDIPNLGRSFGLSEPTAREMQRRGEWAAMGIRVNRLGHKYRVVTADIWNVLGIRPEPTAAAELGNSAAARPDPTTTQMEARHGERTTVS